MKKLAGLILCLVALVSVSYALTTFSLNGTGTKRDTPQFYVDDSGNLTMLGTLTAVTGTFSGNETIAGTLDVTGASSFTGIMNPKTSQTVGTIDTAVSTSTTTGTSAGVRYPVYLGGSTNSVEGSVIVATNPVNLNKVAGMITASSDLTTFIGIAASVVSTGSVVNVYSSGYILALTSGAVSPGDLLVTTSAAAGYLWANNSASANTVVGTALNKGTAASPGLMKIKLK